MSNRPPVQAGKRSRRTCVGQCKPLFLEFSLGDPATTWTFSPIPPELDGPVSIEAYTGGDVPNPVVSQSYGAGPPRTLIVEFENEPSEIGNSTVVLWWPNSGYCPTPFVLIGE